YEVIEGEVNNITHNSITLKNNEIESLYTIGSLFKDALIRENINIGDKIRFNISTGKLNKVLEIEYDGEMQKSKNIDSEVSLLTIDNINSNFNPLSLERISYSVKKISNKNIKSALNNTSTLKLNYLKIEDIHLLSLDELNMLSDLMYEKYIPNLIFTLNTDKLTSEQEKSTLFNKCTTLTLKREDTIKRIVEENNYDENVIQYLKEHPLLLKEVIHCVNYISFDKKRSFDKLIKEFE
ncbi:hypothetical protein H311_01614, partial [Anncaliia algerae PRA109]